MSPSKKKREVEIPRHTETGRIIESTLRNSHILENHVFHYALDESPYDITKRMVETFELMEIPKCLIFAFIKTGRILSEENTKYLSQDELDEWEDAIAQYEKLVASGAILRSDSLVPFISDSKESPNPRKSKAELKHLFDSRNFHEAVVGTSKKQFIEYDFFSSIFSAYKYLLVSIQNRSGKFDIDGAKLITCVFSPKKPILQSSLVRICDDASIQEGIMHLFMGAVLCVRNVFAHKNFYLKDIDQTLEYLSFSSFLFKILDGMEHVDN